MLGLVGGAGKQVNRIFGLSPAARNREVQRAQSPPIPPLARLYSLKVLYLSQTATAQCSVFPMGNISATGAFKQSYPLPQSKLGLHEAWVPVPWI